MANKKKPLGKPLPKTRDSYVDPAPTPEETDELVILFDLYAPKQYKGLLRTQNKSVLEQTGAKPKGNWVWDDKDKRYMDVRTGRKLTYLELHKILSQFAQTYSRR